MKYFAVSVDSNYVAPVPVGWQGIIDKKTIHRKKVYEMQEHLLFRVESHMQTVYTDVITFPCFMVRNCREIICIFLESMLIYVMNEFSDSGGHFHGT